MDTLKELELVEHFKARLALLMRAHGQRCKRAEYAFMRYLRPLSGESRKSEWDRYQRESRKADRLYLRHHRLARRVMGYRHV